MKTCLLSLIVAAFFVLPISAQVPYQVRGLSIALPTSDDVDDFVNFIDKELAPAGLNTLVLRVEYKYEFKSHPELVDTLALSKKEIKRIVKICEKNNIAVIPLIDFLGHQSGSKGKGKLLSVYPEFDETPVPKIPDTTKVVLNGFNMKSYCPRHPEIHAVLFDLIEEICDVFHSDTFHAGMDEVFDLGNDKCPRCSGSDKAELFAEEVTRLRNYLNSTDKKLMIWGDRLIDGKSTGIGRWEGSYNNTHRAIDLIPKDVIICDWHYERPDPTAAIFALKGFQVITCPWRNTESTLAQEKLLRTFISGATKEVQPRYLGMMQTVWGSARNFMDSYYGTAEPDKIDKSAECFKALAIAWQ